MRKGILLLTAIAFTVPGLLAMSPAQADSLRTGDVVYADSFGNLVVESAAGYKRIVVGAGHRAAELRNFVASDEPTVLYAEREGMVRTDCYRPGLWLQGRSHMYGLSPGDAPPMAACR